MLGTRSHSFIVRFLLLALLVLLGASGCAATARWQDPGFRFEPAQFKSTLRARVPWLGEDQVVIPHEIPAKVKRLARQRIRGSAAGLNPVELLVSFLTAPKPEGLGITYDWAVSATAQQTLALGRGDCVSLAMLLVGLGRSLDWPIYFAEARPPQPTTHQFDELAVLSSHMIVIVLTQQGPILVDFLGRIDKSEYDIEPLDDLNAYAHLVNNVAGHQLVSNTTTNQAGWLEAKDSFQLVTQIQPTLGRGWNNLGIAYTRLGDFANARAAYTKAMALDTVFGSPSRNLTIMETRALNPPTIIKRNF